MSTKDGGGFLKWIGGIVATVISGVILFVLTYDEETSMDGVAHVLEHMMFKGTPKVPAGQFSRIIAANGGRDNAFTSRDYTSYFEQLHRSKLDLALKMEADRMKNVIFSADGFAKEIQVVMEERRLRTDDRPGRTLAGLPIGPRARSPRRRCGRCNNRSCA